MPPELNPCSYYVCCVESVKVSASLRLPHRTYPLEQLPVGDWQVGMAHSDVNGVHACAAGAQ